MERLDKILAATGRWSRKEAKEVIRRGRVSVDGRGVVRPEEKIDPETARVRVDGEEVPCRRSLWVMLNKPAGYLSAREDRRSPTVMDLLPRELHRLFPVGRLDRDTEGLLLLTNDGPAAHRLLSPRYHVDKVYYARTEGRLTEEDAAAFRGGLELPGGVRCLPAELEILSSSEGGSEASVTVREGKFHQVRRMLSVLGKPVLYLERVRMGNLPLDRRLKRGEFRFLTEEEVQALSDFP